MTIANKANTRDFKYLQICNAARSENLFTCLASGDKNNGSLAMEAESSLLKTLLPRQYMYMKLCE